MVEATKDATKAASIEKKDPDTKEKKKDEDPDEDLSDEDKALKENLELCVERLKGDDPNLYRPSLESLRMLIRASTTSMTSVPKPLKFMKPHYETMKDLHSKMASAETKKFCAQIISVLAMTNREDRDCLKYRLLADDAEPIGDWGHEYVRHLASEITVEWEDTQEGADRDQLIKLCLDIVPYHMEHNAEAEACDLLMEVEKLDMLIDFIDENAYPRVCLYLTSCVPYVPDPENTNLLRIALRIYEKFNQYPQALRVAMQLNDMKVIEKLLFKCPDKSMQKQLAYMIGRQQITLETPDGEEEDEDLVDIMSNSHLNNNFLSLARELDILEPKTPDDIYKSHIEGGAVGRTPFSGAQPDSAKQNLASSFVNGFVNAAFGKDKLLMPAEDGNKWLYKNKDHGMLSATASLGLILLWDVDGGLTQIDKYLYSAQDHIKSGALLACGLVNCGVRNECDPALALLTDYVLHPTNIMRIGSILGLGLAYAGSNRQDVIELLLKPFNDSRSDMEIIGIAALACGLVAVGSQNEEVTSTIVSTLSEKSPADLKDTYARFLPLGLGLCYLGRQEGYEVHVAVLETLPDPFKSMAKTMVEICAYAGTGNVLKVQDFLKICSEHYEPSTDKEEKKDDKKEKKDKDKDKDKDSSSSAASSTSSASSSSSAEEASATPGSTDLGSQQAVAVLGIALVAMSEDIGTEMALRPFGHLLRYCEPVIRRAVPLALGLLSVSNPKINIIETLSKFSHDSDAEVAHNAIFAMGLVGAGTNNARLASMLRQLATYHSKDVNNLFMVRIAQGLTHLGKGTLTLHPYHNDRQLMSPVAMAGLISTAVCFLDVKNIILGKSHYLLYLLVAAMQPRMLVTLDEELKPLPVSVRVGQAVDVVGQAGKPKTITGFQTHSTPVLLAHGERAELATEEYIPLTQVMEGFVILKKNPDYQEI